MSFLDWLVPGGSGTDEPAARGDPERVREVREVLDEMRPMFEADGGSVALVSVEDGWVEVRLSGACGSCHASDTTLFAAIEPKLRERCPWVLGVRSA